MTPQTKSSLKNVGVIIAACAGVVAVASGATKFVSKAVGVVDAHYVLRDTFVAYQQATARRLDSADRDRKTTLYIACELLHHAQPRAIPLEQCNDAAQAARRYP